MSSFANEPLMGAFADVWTGGSRQASEILEEPTCKAGSAVCPKPAGEESCLDMLALVDGNIKPVVATNHHHQRSMSNSSGAVNNVTVTVHNPYSLQVPIKVISNGASTGCCAAPQQYIITSPSASNTTSPKSLMDVDLMTAYSAKHALSSYTHNQQEHHHNGNYIATLQTAGDVQSLYETREFVEENNYFIEEQTPFMPPPPPRQDTTVILSMCGSSNAATLVNTMMHRWYAKVVNVQYAFVGDDLCPAPEDFDKDADGWCDAINVWWRKHFAHMQLKKPSHGGHW